MNSALLFDFDGTIADTFDLAMRIGRTIIKEFHLHSLTDEEIVNLRTRPLREAVRALKIPFWKIPRLLARIRSEIHENAGSINCFDGMREVLRELRSRTALLGMVTSNSEENVSLLLKRYGIDFFDIGAYSSALFGKAAKLRGLIHRHRLLREEVLYIGDTVGDIESCRKTGIRIAAVTWGYNTKEALASRGPDYLVTSPEQLLDTVARLFPATAA